MNKLLGFTVMGILVACGGEDTPEQGTEIAALPALPANFESMTQMSKVPGSPAVYRAASLCEVMATYHDAGGVFVVEALRSALELDDATGHEVPFTYAVLRTDLEWDSGLPQRFVVRESGGALPGDTPRYVGAPVPLAVGETVVAFLRLRTDENLGFYQLLEPSVFREDGVGLKHGQWFRGERVSAADVRGYFDANVKPTFACRRDAEPTQPNPPATPAQPDGPLTPLPEGAE